MRGAVRAGYVGRFGDLRQKQERIFAKELGIEQHPSKATFGRILGMIDGKQIGEAITDVLHSRFGTAGEIAAMDGKAIRGTAKSENPHRALQILSAYMTDNGVILVQESIHKQPAEARGHLGPGERLLHFLMRRACHFQS